VGQRPDRKKGAIVKAQNIDITNFETELDAFKSGIAKKI
jgi:hypothetical protein